MTRFPDCPHRIDAEEIENNMRGVIKRKIKKESVDDIVWACGKVFDECIEKLSRVLYLMKQMKDGLRIDEETKEHDDLG